MTEIIYLNYNNQGKITGVFVSSDGSNAPESSIEIPKEDYDRVASYLNFCTIVNGALVEPDSDLIAVEQNKISIKAQIVALEASITSRRWRDAALTEEGMTWLENIEIEITNLRNQL